jgi:hypothetical protein
MKKTGSKKPATGGDKPVGAAAHGDGPPLSTALSPPFSISPAELARMTEVR